MKPNSRRQTIAVLEPRSLPNAVTPLASSRQHGGGAAGKTPSRRQSLNYYYGKQLLGGDDHDENNNDTTGGGNVQQQPPIQQLPQPKSLMPTRVTTTRKVTVASARQRAGSFGRPRGNSLDLVDENAPNNNNNINDGKRVIPPRESDAMMLSMQLGGGGGGPRSSMYGLMQQDQRDFSQTGMIRLARRVVEFLAIRGFGREISESALMSPTVALFRDVLVAMVSLMDSNLADDLATKAKTRGAGWETAACLFFKKACYPFQLSPKQIVAVGSANAWPKFLGALAWLADLYDMEDSVQEILATNDKPRYSLFGFMEEGYRGYMGGDDSATSAVTNKLRADVDVKVNEVRKEVTELRTKLERLEAEHARLKDGNPAADMAALEDRRDQLQTDVVTYGQVLGQWKKKLEATEIRTERTEEDKVRLEGELGRAKADRAAAEAALQAQPIKGEEAQRMMDEKDRASKAIDEIMRKKQQQLAINRQADVILTELKEEFNKTVNDCNSRLRFLCPDLADDGIMLVPDWPSHETARGALLSQSRIGSLITPELQRIRDDYLARAHEARQRTLDMQDFANRNRDECREIEERIQSRRMQAKRADERNTAEIEATNKELEAIEAEIFAIQEAHSIAHVQRAADDYEAELENIRFEIEEEKDKFAREEAEMHDTFHVALQLAIEYKEQAEDVVQKLEGIAGKEKNKVEKAVLEFVGAVEGSSGGSNVVM